MKEIIAQENMYLTQAMLDDENNRIFVKKLCGYAVNEDDWRNATQEEKEQWEAEHQPEQLNNE